jgi:biotin transport system permease protein
MGAFLSDLKALPTLALIIIILSIAGGIKPWELLRGSRPLLVFTIFIFLFKALEWHPALEEEPGRFALNPEGLKEGILFGLRVGICFSAGALFFALTTIGEVKKSLSRLESFLRLERLRLGLAVSLMLMFLPRFFEKWEEVNLAWKSRGGGKSFRKLKVLIPLSIEKMMELAVDTAEALETRGAMQSE